MQLIALNQILELLQSLNKFYCGYLENYSQTQDKEMIEHFEKASKLYILSWSFFPPFMREENPSITKSIYKELLYLASQLHVITQFLRNLNI
jgi:hypothetical protein